VNSKFLPAVPIPACICARERQKVREGEWAEGMEGWRDVEK